MEPKPEPVGTELSKLIPKWAVKVGEGCGCKDMAKKMDNWGIEGCEQRFDQIVKHLMTQSNQLIPAFSIVPAPARKYVATKLLEKAISNARENASR